MMNKNEKLYTEEDLKGAWNHGYQSGYTRGKNESVVPNTFENFLNEYIENEKEDREEVISE